MRTVGPTEQVSIDCNKSAAENPSIVCTDTICDKPQEPPLISASPHALTHSHSLSLPALMLERLAEPQIMTQTNSQNQVRDAMRHRSVCRDGRSYAKSQSAIGTIQLYIICINNRKGACFCRFGGWEIEGRGREGSTSKFHFNWLESHATCLAKRRFAKTDQLIHAFDDKLCIH